MFAFWTLAGYGYVLQWNEKTSFQKGGVVQIAIFTSQSVVVKAERACCWNRCQATDIDGLPNIGFPLREERDGINDASLQGVGVGHRVQ